MVTLTPDVGYMRLPGVVPSRVASIQSASCPIINGDVYPPDTTIENLPAIPGVVVMATEQPAGEPNRVNWTASISLSGGASMGTIAIDVPSNGIVDLATIVPAVPQPGIIKVVSSEDRIGAELAAADAAASATAASASETAAVAARTAAESAQTGAQAAETSATAAQAGAEDAATVATTARTGAESARDTAQETADGIPAAVAVAIAAQVTQLAQTYTAAGGDPANLTEALSTD
ncbi:MAG: hypothetical protein ACTH4Y_11785 [Microbacterium gubbeenense]